jgi:hypothetical protein
MSLKEKMNQDYDRNRDIVSQQGNTDWYKFKEGKNVIQVLAEPEAMVEKYKVGICFPGCGYKGSTKYLTYVLADGKVMKMKLPIPVMDVIAELEASSRFGFNGFPMPYQLEVTATKAGTKDVTYATLPGDEAEVPAEVIAQLAKLDQPAAIIKAMQDKQRKAIAEGTVVIPEAEQEPGYADSVAQAEPPFEDPEQGQDNEVHY